MTTVGAFWNFVRERHAIYVRRFVRKLPPPWTSDPVLANYHFTNVYRELDPGTEFIRQELRAHASAPWHEMLLNVAMYRLCLWEGSFARIGWSALAGFSGAEWAARVAQDPQPWHGTYYIHNLGLRIPKHEAMGMVAEALARFLDAGGPPTTSRQDWLSAVATVKGIGGFIATQALADLTYEPGYVPLPEDGYVMLGPGAMRGLALVAGVPELTEYDAQAWLERLHAGQDEERTGSLEGFPALTLMNLQNCCCEYSKYMKGKGRKKFDAQSRQVQQGSLL